MLVSLPPSRRKSIREPRSGTTHIARPDCGQRKHPVATSKMQLTVALRALSN
jgi:hypothetical protein